jgi:hypothetical protein
MSALLQYITTILFPTFQYSEEVELLFVAIETLKVAMGREEGQGDLRMN